MPSQFPMAFDNLTTGFNPGDPITSANADLVNACVNAVEQNLGTNGQGTYPTIGAAVAGKLDKAAGGTMGADIAMGSHRVTGLLDPANPQDAATRNYVDNLAQGMSWHSSARAATTGDVAGATYNATGGPSGHGQLTTMPSSLDAVALNAGDRVLVKNQTTGSQNGIYAVTTVGTGANGVWDRAVDFDDQNDAVGGVSLWVAEGTLNAESAWLLTNPVGYVIGGSSGSNLSFIQFSGAGQITAGPGLVKNGNTLSVGAGPGIQVNSGSVQIDPAYPGQASITTVGNITAGTWNGSAVPVSSGGTGQTTPAGAFNALSPMSAAGDVIYGGTSGAGTRLPGNPTTTRQFLTGTGTGSAAQAPSWSTIAVSDVPTLDHTKISDFDPQVRTSRLDQMAAAGANVNLNSNRINNLTDPASAQDAATKNYVDTQLGAATPSGAIVTYAGVTIPSGYLACDGSAVSRATYGSLFSALTFAQTGTTSTNSVFITGLSSTASMYVGMALTGTGVPSGSTITQITSSTSIQISNQAAQSGSPSITFYPYGAGDGSLTFNVPDLRGRAAVGNGQGTGLSDRLVGQSGGEETHKLVTSEMPSHAHDMAIFQNQLWLADGGSSFGPAYLGGSRNTANQGGDAAHNNMQPYLVISYLIKT